MSMLTPTGVLEALAGVDPAPFFGLSLLPYLAFLWWSWRRVWAAASGVGRRQVRSPNAVRAFVPLRPSALRM